MEVVAALSVVAAAVDLFHDKQKNEKVSTNSIYTVS